MPHLVRGTCKNPTCRKPFQREVTEKDEIQEGDLVARGNALFALVCPHCGHAQKILRKKSGDGHDGACQSDE
jgi:hypothetical protein